jgi:hypothetical protein
MEGSMMKKAARPKTQRRLPGNGRSKLQKVQIAATIAALDQVQAETPKAAKVIALLHSWLSDESGYDEKAWPQLKKALDEARARVGARRLFNGPSG